MKPISEKPKRVMYSPKKVDLTITGKCNLRCIYCFHYNSPADLPKDLSTDEWLSFFEELNAASVLSVSVSGGEAFIRKDFNEIIEGIVKNRMRFNVLSNGTLITDEKAEFLASTNRCDSVQVSIDGPSSSVHDLTCGSGSFEKAVRGLQALKKYGINRTVRLTITKQNYMYLEEAADTLLGELGLRSFSTNSACPFGMTKKNAKDIMLGPDEFSKSMELHDRVIKKYGKRISAQAGPLSCHTHWSENEYKVKNKVAPKPGGGYLTSCGGVFTKLSVRSDGTITPCTQMPHIELGRINKDNFLDIWQNHPELKRLRERRLIPLSNFEYCRDCEYRPYCHGGCPANAYELFADENHPVYSVDSCYKKFLEEGGKMPLKEIEVIK